MYRYKFNKKKQNGFDNSCQSNCTLYHTCLSIFFIESVSSVYIAPHPMCIYKFKSIYLAKLNQSNRNSNEKFGTIAKRMNYNMDWNSTYID